MQHNKQSGINEIFEQRKRIYKLSVPFSSFRRRALKALRGSDATFDDWMRVHDDPDSDPNLKKISLDEMFKRALTIDDYICFYVRATRVSDKQKALKNISKIDADFEKLVGISLNPDSHPRVKKIIDRRIEEFSTKGYVKILGRVR